VKILLVEGDELSRDMLARRLARRGYEVVVAVDPAGGVTRAQTDAPDVILMDLSLPVNDALAAMQQIRATASTRSIPIIALTAHPMAGDREEALAAGCNDYDTKPIEFDRLLVKIQALVKA